MHELPLLPLVINHLLERFFPYPRTFQEESESCVNGKRNEIVILLDMKKKIAANEASRV